MIETIKNWLLEWPGMARFDGLQVDFGDFRREGAGLYPLGLEELERTTDIYGAVTVRNRCRFTLSFLLEKPAGDAPDNAGWLLELQQWAQRRALAGDVPRFGTRTERLELRKGTLSQADECMGRYTAELVVEWKE